MPPFLIAVAGSVVAWLLLKRDEPASAIVRTTPQQGGEITAVSLRGNSPSTYARIEPIASGPVLKADAQYNKGATEALIAKRRQEQEALANKQWVDAENAKVAAAKARESADAARKAAQNSSDIMSRPANSSGGFRSA